MWKTFSRNIKGSQEAQASWSFQMRHVMLTCKNHPNLRWFCKSIAFTPGKGYNGVRHIFFEGDVTEPGCHGKECTCPGADLILAPGEVWDKECED